MNLRVGCHCSVTGWRRDDRLPVVGNGNMDRQSRRICRLACFGGVGCWLLVARCGGRRAMEHVLEGQVVAADRERSCGNPRAIVVLGSNPAGSSPARRS